MFIQFIIFSLLIIGSTGFAAQPPKNQIEQKELDFLRAKANCLNARAQAFKFCVITKPSNAYQCSKAFRKYTVTKKNLSYTRKAFFDCIKKSPLKSEMFLKSIC